MNRTWGTILPYAVFLGLGLTAGSAHAAPVADAVPEDAYESLTRLAAQGYVDMPPLPLESYSRAELASMAARALVGLERARTASLPDEYGRLTRLVAMDEVQLKLAREQEAYAQKKLAAARHQTEKATEQYVRRALQGQNRLEIMQPLKEKSDHAQQQLEFAARDYAEAESRTKQRTRMLAYARERQAQVLEAMSTGEAASSASLPAAPQAAGSTTSSPSPSPLDDAARLRAVFAGELAAAGTLDALAAGGQLASNLPVRDVPEQRLKVDAELRLDSGHSTGEHGIGDRTRLRARVYPDYNIDGNWHAKGMVELEKTLAGPDDSHDGKPRLDRYYLEGDIGAVRLDAGAFASFMAEGNIYDSKFKGVRLAGGGPVHYAAEYGQLGQDVNRRAYDLTASYNAKSYGVDAGYYHFEQKDGSTRQIYMANYRRPLGVLDFGAMALHGKDSGQAGQNGFVLSLAYAPENSWKPKASTYWLKYYRQPASTYISHTMNGMADRMMPHGGFRGWGLGYGYNIAKDWSLALEFYRLQDLNSGHYSNTIWGSLTTYFKNYEE